MIRTIEQLGAHITTASVDVTDEEQVTAWLSDHTRAGRPPVRGIIHAAGSVHDQLLVNMSEADFAKVVAAKITGTRVLHDAFEHHDLEFFVMFGSAGRPSPRRARGTTPPPTPFSTPSRTTARRRASQRSPSGGGRGRWEWSKS